MHISYRNLLFGAFVGAGLLFGIIKFYPDGKLHLVFCNVGQGDAIYVKFPSGADMLMDAGPDSKKILTCLGNHMPFYDRKIDMVFLSHPQLDHYGGMAEVVSRYEVKYFVSSFNVKKFPQLKKLNDLLTQKHTVLKNIASGQTISIDAGNIKVIWPEANWLALNYPADESAVLGIGSEKETNLLSPYLDINYGNFDALLTGDGDSDTQQKISLYNLKSLLPESIDILKVPHHGSKISVSEEFLNQIKPKLSVIQVGKNSYGHPNSETVDKLAKWGKVFRTDQDGEIEIVSDGNGWYREE